MNYVSLVVFNLLPIALLSILNIQLVKTLRRVVDQDRRRSSGADTQQMLPHVQFNVSSKTPYVEVATLVLYAISFDLVAVEFFPLGRDIGIRIQISPANCLSLYNLFHACIETGECSNFEIDRRRMYLSLLNQF